MFALGAVCAIFGDLGGGGVVEDILEMVYR